MRLSQRAWRFGVLSSPLDISLEFELGKAVGVTSTDRIILLILRSMSSSIGMRPPMCRSSTAYCELLPYQAVESIALSLFPISPISFPPIRWRTPPRRQFTRIDLYEKGDSARPKRKVNTVFGSLVVTSSQKNQSRFHASSRYGYKPSRSFLFTFPNNCHPVALPHHLEHPQSYCCFFIRCRLPLCDRRY